MKATLVSFGSTMLKPHPHVSLKFALLGPADVAFLRRSLINSFNNISIKKSETSRLVISLSTHLGKSSFTKYRIDCACFFSSSDAYPLSVEGDIREQQEEQDVQEHNGLDIDDDDDGDKVEDIQVISDCDSNSGNGLYIELQELGKRSRRIQCKIKINASVQTLWNLLTDYERLPDFIPGLVRSDLLEKRDGFARLFQVGQQSLAIGLKFNAKGIIECYEKDLEIHCSGRRRCIEFKMIEGDFLTFEGKWSIEQYNADRCEAISDHSQDPRFCSVLSYIVDVEPKRWLPVRLVEGILCREIKTNLSSIKEEAQKSNDHTYPAC